MVNFLTGVGGVGGVGAESGRGLRAFTTGFGVGATTCGAGEGEFGSESCIGLVKGGPGDAKGCLGAGEDFARAPGPG